MEFNETKELYDAVRSIEEQFNKPKLQAPPLKLGNILWLLGKIDGTKQALVEELALAQASSSNVRALESWVESCQRRLRFQVPQLCDAIGKPYDRLQKHDAEEIRRRICDELGISKTAANLLTVEEIVKFLVKPYLGIRIEDGVVEREGFPIDADLRQKHKQQMMFVAVFRRKGTPVANDDLADEIYSEKKSSSALPNLRRDLNLSLRKLKLKVDKDYSLREVAPRTKKSEFELSSDFLPYAYIERDSVSRIFSQGYRQWQLTRRTMT